MRKLAKGRPSPALIVSIVALCAALGGTAVAANKINGHRLQPQSVGGGKLKQFTGGLLKKQSLGGGKIKKDTLTAFQVDEKRLSTVPSAEKLSGDARYSVRLGFNQAAALATIGPFTLIGQCVANVTDSEGKPGRDVARVLIGTTEVNSVFDGTAGSGGLNPTTPGAERIAFEYSVPTGTSGYASGGGVTAYAPSGAGVAVPDGGNGGGVNIYGAGCALHGAAFSA